LPRIVARLRQNRNNLEGHLPNNQEANQGLDEAVQQPVNRGGRGLRRQRGQAVPVKQAQPQPEFTLEKIENNDERSLRTFTYGHSTQTKYLDVLVY